MLVRRSFVSVPVHRVCPRFASLWHGSGTRTRPEPRQVRAGSFRAELHRRNCGSVQLDQALPAQPSESVRYSWICHERTKDGKTGWAADQEDVYQRLDNPIAELWQRMGGLPNPLEAADIWRGIWYEEAHHSTALEGNTLVLKEVEALLAEGRAVGDKELREYAEVKGYADAAEWVYQQATQPDSWSAGEILSLAEVRMIHATAMTPVWDIAPHGGATQRETPGSFREHDIYPFPGGMTPPSWVFVAAELTLG